jgi:hypothetical protein
VWLKDTCTIARASGYGTGTATSVLYSGIKYKHEINRDPQIVSSDGGGSTPVSHNLKFAVGQDVRVKDIITDTTTGERFRIEGQADGSFKFLQTFTATEYEEARAP